MVHIANGRRDVPCHRELNLQLVITLRTKLLYTTMTPTIANAYRDDEAVLRKE